MRGSQGIELMKQLSEGRIEVAPSEYLIETREKVSQALEELVEVGARIRPLVVDRKRVGWVRGVHLSERKALKRWLTDESEFIEQLLLLGTTLTIEEIRDLTLIELRSLSRLIQQMSESDLRLYSFVSPFVTTNVSEQLWFSQGTALTTYRERQVALPDGKQVRVSLPSDQARLWATLCNYRIQAKERLEASSNAVLTIRPLVGKGADPISADLKAISRSLQTDALDPWRETVKYRSEVNFDDGWAHSEDDSREGILRELNNMVSNDRHERLFARFDEQERLRAEKRRQEIEQRITQRGGRGFRQSATKIMSRQEVLEREAKLRQAGVRPMAVFENENESSPEDRLAKYR